MMAVEGVLGDGSVFSPSMQPTRTGQRLYFALQEWYRVVLVSSHPDPTAVEWWLRLQGLKGHAEVLANPDPELMDTVLVRAAQLRPLRANRTAVELVVDTDPSTVTMAMQQGITGLLYGSARVGTDRLDLRRKRRDWDDIQAEMNHQQDARPAQTAETP